MHVVLGTRETQAFRVAELAAYYRSVKGRFEAVIDGDGRTEATIGAALSATYPEPVEHCAVCRWERHCAARREADDHLSLVANIRRSQRMRLGQEGITTVAELAEARSSARPLRIGRGTFETLCAQARLQMAQRATGEHSYELLKPVEEHGFARLPESSEGDVFFDMEGDPFFDDGLEYLFGCVFLSKTQNQKSKIQQSQFKSFWATNRSSEKQAFERFIDFTIERLERWPDLHVYHYGTYEATALRRLMGLHATREEEVDRLLRGKVLVDLYAVVRQALRVSQPNYSIKSIEAFYMDERATEVAEGGDSIIAFERYLETGDAVAAGGDRALQRGRLSLDASAARMAARPPRGGDRAVRIRDPVACGPESWEPDAEAQEELDALQAGLLDGVPEDVVDQDEDQHGRWLMAQLTDYHRREAKPAWWAYFERLEADEEQMTEVDTEALGGLVDTGAEPTRHPQHPRSLVHTLSFPPQEHKVGPGGFIDPASERGVTVESIDNATGTLRIIRAANRVGEPLPRALIPGGPYDTRVQRAALRRLAEDIIARGFDTEGGSDAAGGHGAGGRYGALRQILRRALPLTSACTRGEALQAGAFDLDRARRIAEGLDDSYLFVQGPPGSGKTYTGAHLILHLIRQGHRVGVASGSHAAIHNQLAEVEKWALPDEPLAGLKRYSDDDHRYESEHGLIESSKDVADCLDPRYNLIAGTAWLFCREELDGTLDYLLIDEAGQISLADALAMGTCARNVILLGDPQQLAQVSQAIHPPGAGVSVLEHLLADSTTIPPERGLFIDETRRMHPDVCRFVSEAVYEGRLESAAECATQRIDAPGKLTGTGVRYVPVAHEGNTRSSPEEAQAIASLVEDLLKGRYARADRGDADGGDADRLDPLRPEDIMVVSPYNAQVRCLREHLPDGVQVGTVDKFQGQEAAVCFFSMATSSGDEIPRHLEFLFSRNRLNVAISRARCLAVLVCNPELLHIRCRSAEEMRLVNALCLFVEMAGED